MSSTYSPDLRIELIGTGDQAGVWGSTTNNNLGTFIENAVAGYTSVAIIASPQALTANDGAADEARFAAIALTTVTGANFTVCIPPNSKLYTFYNASSYTATISNSTVKNGVVLSGGTTVAIPAGKTVSVWSDGTNVAQQSDYLISPTLVTPVLGTPASGTLTNCTGLPVNSGISGLGTGVATFLATPSSANLKSAVTDETGSGALVFATSPTLVTPVLGTPSSGTLTSCTGLPIVDGTTGTLSVARGGTGVTTSTGSGNVVLSTSPTLVTPALGTPSALVGTNITGTAASLSIGGNAATATALSTASGSAPSYSVRAWANYNGSADTVNASANIASIVRNAIGEYTVTFTTAMQDANYVQNISCGNGGSNIAAVYLNQNAAGTEVVPTASSFTFVTNQPGSGLRDQKYISISVVR